MQIEPKTFPNSIAFALFGMVLLFAFFTPITYGQDKLDHESVRNYYSYWKAKYIKPSKRVKGGSFVDFEAKGSTCSEAQGYGMLITVYLSESNQEFESLNLFRQQFKSNIDARLMAWKIDDKKSTPVDTTCATDGDLDIAYALILASEKWKAPEYLKQARTILTGIEESLVRSDFSLRRGDWDTQQHSTRLSDFMPGHFATFARVSDPKIWRNVLKTHYEIIDATCGKHCVFPDFVIKEKEGWIAAPPEFLESKYDGAMYYNACRVPWRLAAAAIENNDHTAIAILARFNQGIGKVKNQKFMAGYWKNGKAINDWTDGSFTAPHMCSLKANKRNDEFKAAMKFQLTQKESYFPDTIRMLTLCLCSGITVTDSVTE